MASIAKELAKHPLLDKDWSTLKIATQAITRNGYTMDQVTDAGYELRQPADARGRWAICPAERWALRKAKPEAVPAPRKRRAKIEPIHPDAPTITMHLEPEVETALAAHEEPTEQEPDMDDAPISHASQAPATEQEPEESAPGDEQIEEFMTERQTVTATKPDWSGPQGTAMTWPTATSEQTAPQGTFSLLLEETFATLEQAETWARDAARKLRTIIRVRDAGGTVVAEIAPTRQPAKPHSADGSRADTTGAMVAAMTVTGGATAEQIQAAGGWANKPAIVHMDRWATARGFRLHVHSNGGKKRYEAVFPAGA